MKALVSNSRQRKPQPNATVEPARKTPFLSLESAPVVLVLREMAAVYRMGISTIRQQLAEGTFRPKPFAVRPYRWLKSDVETDLNRRAEAGAKTRRRRKPGAPADVNADVPA